jgi:hypothetical protein
MTQVVGQAKQHRQRLEMGLILRTEKGAQAA